MKPLLLKLWKFFFPPSRWHRCQPMNDAERLAAFEIRMGRWRAEERMRRARVDQLFDERASATVKPKVTPRLPQDRVVVPMRRKRVA